MENASKALIIAGAILISILIIGIGVYIYSTAEGVIKKTDMTAQEIRQYNAPFTTYEGTNVSGTQAMALCDEVRQHDLAHQTDLSKQIQVVADTAKDTKSDSFTAAQTSTATTVKASLRSGYTYTITFGYDSSTGLVTQVGIKKN